MEEMRKGNKKLRGVQMLSALLLLLVAISCEKAENTYSNLVARFSQDQVISIAPLRIACDSKGEFCLIYSAGANFVYKSFTNEQSRPITDLDKQKGFIMGLSGFIVGQPPIPDDANPIVCYDAACPNCYVDQMTTKRLQLISNDMARCSGCRREYNLSDHGFVKNGKESDRRLIRYRAVYQRATDILIINN